MTVWELVAEDRERGARVLIEEYDARLYATAFRLCLNEQDAEDLVQRTLVRAIERIATYNGASAFFTWMCAILINFRRMDVRRKAANALVFDDTQLESPDARPDPGESLAQADEAAALRRAVACLPEDLRLAVVMHYFNGVSRLFVDGKQAQPVAYKGPHAGGEQIPLPESELENLRVLKRAGKRIVSVVFAGRPVIMDEIVWLSDAVIMAWYPGAMGGEALAEILAGEVNPSGKLAQYIPLDVGQIPLSYREKRTFIACAYADLPAKPLFPFGYGLSYTTFSYGRPVDLGASNGMHRVAVTVMNTGKVTGREIVQLYVRDEVASVLPRERELKDFTSVTLAPGERRTLVFALTDEAFALYDADLRRVVEPGDFTVYIGGDSTTTNGVRIAVR